jgi:glycosyltransferase involved in cell wall biosynthesis
LNGLFDQCSFLPRGVSRISTHVRKYVQEIERLRPDALVINDSPYVMAALPFIPHTIVRAPVIHSAEPLFIQMVLTDPQWWDRAIAVSESAANAVPAPVRNARVSVCPLGVPTPNVDRNVVKNRGQHHPIQIVFVGRIVVPYKRLDRLPLIARILTERDVDFHWTILGDGEFLPKLSRELSESGLLSRFSLKGSVPSSVVASELEKADVFVMPSDSEGMPQALLEAMAHGVVPVVSRISGSTTRIVEDRKCGYLCEATRPEEFAKAIDELAGDPALRRKMGINAAETIARHFSLETFTARFLDIIEEARSSSMVRTPPFPPEQIFSPDRHMGCRGFWRCLRTQTLGRLKRRLCGRRFIGAARAGALSPAI